MAHFPPTAPHSSSINPTETDVLFPCMKVATHLQREATDGGDSVAKLEAPPPPYLRPRRAMKRNMKTKLTTLFSGVFMMRSITIIDHDSDRYPVLDSVPVLFAIPFIPFSILNPVWIQVRSNSDPAFDPGPTLDSNFTLFRFRSRS
ncbi:hypothetical protein EVAR_74978_1 [Eumeta japonica]|uniref:Uncharacterized protein n=1 Tax=Eumeta variegata TaxID=151549 RepID=A0A4C1VAC5_EUMVA|nr:hypothetical protein EVAR_74978_1 [Eumeta japonica]